MGENNNEGRCSELVLPLIGSFSYSPFFFHIYVPQRWNEEKISL